MVLALVLFLAAFVGMEGFAHGMHKYVMHGPLWVIHRSHHRPRTGWFEANDWFGVVFSLPAIAAIYLGTHGTPWLLPIGTGITAYGAAYFLFHDVLVHRRVHHGIGPFRGYLLRITRAHLIHHRASERHGAVSFGFLWAPESLSRASAPASTSRSAAARPGGS